METKFYCDKCGKDVAINSEVCPHCGETFAAVKCPVCNLIGKPSLFVDGCPSCGFMAKGRRQTAGKWSSVSGQKKKPPSLHSAESEKEEITHPRIPARVYKILIAVFCLILIGLLYILFRLR